MTAIKPLAYYATLEHAKWMLGTDGQYLSQISEHKSVEAATRMMRDYNVARTIWGKGGLPDFANSVFKKIGSIGWPEDLEDRAAWCADVADENRDSKPVKSVGRKQGAPYSAATKLCWFICPKGWTMFDRFARLGLTNLTGSNGRERFLSFYRALEKTGFSEKARSLNRIIHDDLGFERLYAERIIDSFLMMRGQIWSAKDCEVRATEIRQHNQLFLDNLLALEGSGASQDQLLGNRLAELATKMGEALPNNSFETRYVKNRLDRLPA